MLPRLDPNDPRPLYVQLMDEVRRSIATGVLQPGDAVISIRQLARELRINPMTVKQAYDGLEREGILEMRRGRGTFVPENISISETRGDVAQVVAERALRDAYRHGLSLTALVAAIREAARRDQSRPPLRARRSGTP